MTRHLLLLLPTTRIFMSSMFNIIAAGLVSTSNIDAARETMFTIFVQDET